MEDQTKSMRFACASLVFLGIGVVCVLYGWYLLGRAAESDFAPSRAMLQSAAIDLFLFGVPALFLGCLSLIGYKLYKSDGMVFRHETLMPKSAPPVISASGKVACPDCGFVLDLTLEIMKHDGSVICSKCLKKFIPTA